MTLEAAAPPPPTYAERRTAMADATRTSILDACIEILARDVSELSVPNVARAANVSVPTVYRNFPDKKALVRETALYLRRRHGTANGPSIPERLEDLPGIARAQFARDASQSETFWAAATSAPIAAHRRASGEREMRMAGVARMLDEATRGWPARDRQHAIWMTTVLCSSNTHRAFQKLTGITTDQTVDTVLWAIAKMVGRDSLDAAPRKRKRTAKKR